MALNCIKPLSVAYSLKEDFKLLWEQSSKQHAEKFLGKLAPQAMVSNVIRLKSLPTPYQPIGAESLHGTYIQ